MDPYPDFQLTEDQIIAVRKAFSMVDLDGSDSIDAAELRQFLKQCGEEPSEYELMELMQELDADGNGTVEYTELLEAVRRWIAEIEESAALDDEQSMSARR